MHSDLPIVANAAAAIPETLGDGGILLETKTPEAVAAELDRVVHDQALRKELIEKGRRRVEAFSRPHVADRLKLALAQGGWELPNAKSKKIVVMSSDQRCGIHHYSLAVTDWLRDRGHQVTFVGVKHLDTADLYRKLRFISPQSDAVLIEHEAGIFRDVPFVRALLSLWRKRLPVILSLHELEPEKFHHYRRLSAALHYNPRYSMPLEILRMPWVALRMANWFLRYRLVLMFMGTIPRKLVVHSTRSERWLQLLTPDQDKRERFPLLIMPLENTVLPRNPEEKRKLRARFGLPTDKFIFVSPGFFFARKRYKEVIEALPDIQKPETYAKYLRGVRILRRLLSPERNAERYLAGVQ